VTEEFFRSKGRVANSHPPLEGRLSPGSRGGNLRATSRELQFTDRNRRAFYYDYVLAGRSDEARKYLEDLMSVGTYDWQSDFAREYVGIGRAEGREEGREEGVARSVVAVLRARGFTVSDEIRRRIESGDDLETLEAWVPKAAAVARPEDLFG
jgi:hypothetical protein